MIEIDSEMNSYVDIHINPSPSELIIKSVAISFKK